MRKDFKSVGLISLDRNYGFSEGYNRVLREIQAEYYVILNSDIEVTEGWLDPLVKTLDNQKDVAAVMPKILAWERPEYFEHAGAAGGFIDKFGYPFCRGRILNHIEKDRGQYDQVTDVFWATGACVCLRADLFHKFGGFDDFMFAHMEEIDLCWRLKNHGYRILFIPSSRIFHVGGGTLPNEHPRKLYLNFRNNLILLYKNLPARLKTRVLFIRLLLDGLAAFKFLLSFKPLHFAAIIKAHIHFYKVLPEYREKLTSKGIRDLPDGMLKASVLYNFYVRGKKTFDQLPKQFE